MSEKETTEPKTSRVPSIEEAFDEKRDLDEARQANDALSDPEGVDETPDDDDDEDDDAGVL